MERATNSNEYQDIILASADKEQLPKIDVVERVMGRIMPSAASRRPLRQMLMSRTMAAAGMLMLLLLVSVTAYAASEYIQIRNGAGTVKVQHIPRTEIPVATYNKYEQQAEAFAKPGELIAYYVKDKAGSGDLSAELQFKYKERRITAYSDFLRESQRTKAPVLPEAPVEYSFVYGTVSPTFPTTEIEKNGTLYKETLYDLMAQANKANGSGNLFMKAIPWSESGSISGVYSHGEGYIGISATMMHGRKVIVEQESENKVDKIMVAGQEVVYNNVNKEHVSYHYLNWYNEEEDAYYTLTTYGDNRLSKEELLQLASELAK